MTKNVYNLHIHCIYSEANLKAAQSLAKEYDFDLSLFSPLLNQHRTLENDAPFDSRKVQEHTRGRVNYTPIIHLRKTCTLEVFNKICEKLRDFKDTEDFEISLSSQ